MRRLTVGGFFLASLLSAAEVRATETDSPELEGGAGPARATEPDGTELEDATAPVRHNEPTIEDRLRSLEAAQQEMMRTLVKLAQRTRAFELRPVDSSMSRAQGQTQDLRRLQMEVQSLRSRLIDHTTSHGLR